MTRCSIVVHNLNYKEKEEDVRSLFKVAGEISKLEIVQDKRQKSRGIALITYKDPDDARYAVTTYNNAELNNKRLRVDYDKRDEIDFEERFSKKLDDQKKQYERRYQLLEEKYNSLSKQFESLQLLNNQYAQKLEEQTGQFAQQIEHQSKHFSQKLEEQTDQFLHQIEYNSVHFTQELKEQSEQFANKYNDLKKHFEDKYQDLNKYSEFFEDLNGRVHIRERIDFYDRCMCNSILNIKYQALIHVGKEWTWDERMPFINELIPDEEGASKVKVEVTSIQGNNPIQNLPCFLFNGGNKEMKVNGSQWISKNNNPSVTITFEQPELVNVVVMEPVSRMFGISNLPNRFEVFGVDDTGFNRFLKEFSGIEWNNNSSEKIFPFFNGEKYKTYIIKLYNTAKSEPVGLSKLNLCRII